MQSKNISRPLNCVLKCRHVTSIKNTFNSSLASRQPAGLLMVISFTYSLGNLGYNEQQPMNYFPGAPDFKPFKPKITKKLKPTTKVVIPRLAATELAAVPIVYLAPIPRKKRKKKNTNFFFLPELFYCTKVTRHYFYYSSSFNKVTFCSIQPQFNLTYVNLIMSKILGFNLYQNYDLSVASIFSEQLSILDALRLTTNCLLFSIFQSLLQQKRLLLLVSLVSISVNSASRFFPSASWAEREVIDFFFLTFSNLKNNRRLLLDYTADRNLRFMNIGNTYFDQFNLEIFYKN